VRGKKVRLNISLSYITPKVKVNKYYELQAERREVVADIVKRLTGSVELLPEEYKGS
jgi:hypothetical protein